MEKHKIEFILPADLKFSSLVRRISEEFFHYAGFAREWVERLKLVVDELFMNANKYGSKSEDDKIYIRFEFDDKEVNFRIEDEGRGGKKLNAKELKKVISKNTDEASDLNKTRGRGLALICSLWTDDIMVEDSLRGGIAISFAKQIAAGPPPPQLAAFQVDEGSKGVLATAVQMSQGPKEEIKISGEIDASNLEGKVRSVVEKVEALPTGGILVLDCEDLIYINSTFIGHMAGWLNKLQSKNSHLVLRNVNRQIREVLDLVGLSKVIYLES